MKLSRLKPATDYDVRKWIEESIPELTAYQKQRILLDDVVRLAPFCFYKKPDFKKEKVTFWWRFTIFLVPVYVLLIALFVLLKFVITGDKYLPQTYLDNFHYPWMRKLKLDL